MKSSDLARRRVLYDLALTCLRAFAAVLVIVTLILTLLQSQLNGRRANDIKKLQQSNAQAARDLQTLIQTSTALRKEAEARDAATARRQQQELQQIADAIGLLFQPPQHIVIGASPTSAQPRPTSTAVPRARRVKNPPRKNPKPRPTPAPSPCTVRLPNGQCLGSL